MSGTAKLRAKPTVWHEGEALAAPERRKLWALRAGAKLVVTLAVDASRESGRVTASVEAERQASAMAWPIADVSARNRRTIDATIAVAQRWAEVRADEIRDGRTGQNSAGLPDTNRAATGERSAK